MGPGGKQRTDSTHVVAAVRDRHRLELAGESVRACLEALAVAAPWWLAGVIDVPGWSRRYSVRVDSWRLPSSQAKRVELALAYARDGYALVEACYRADTPGWRREVEAVQVLRIVLLQNATRTVTEAGTEVQANRADQDAADWQARYAIRAGVEGTIHQAIAVTGTRNARYKGLPKTHLEHVYAAVALNLIRLHAWWNGHPLDRTRTAISPDQNSRWPRSRELTTRVTVRGKRALSAPGMACTVAAAGAQPYYRAHLVRTQLRATHEFAHPTSTRTGYGSAGIRHARDHATQQTHRRYQRTASTITSGGSRTGEGGPCNGIGGRGEFS